MSNRFACRVSYLIPLATFASIGGAVAQTPLQPPYFVRAWTAQDQRIHTLESSDGNTWVRERILPLPSGSGGAVASFADDANTWLVMWNASGGLRFVTGAGGLPSTVSTGITWFDNTSTAIPTNATVGGVPAVNRTADNRFMVVFEDANGQLHRVPSAFPAPAVATDVPLGFAGSNPALAFGGGRHVLAYKLNNNLVARTSVDGQCWSAPRTIFPLTTVADPPATITSGSVSLSFSRGTFFAVSKVTTHTEDLLGSRLRVFRSDDGLAWTQVGGPGPSVSVDSGIPGGTFARCALTLGYESGSYNLMTGAQTAAPNQCLGPTSLTFANVVDLAATQPAPGGRTSVVFSQERGPSVPIDMVTRSLWSTPSVDFGQVPLGDIRTKLVTIRNTGAVPISVNVPAAPAGGAFQWGALNQTLACGGEVQFDVEFSPGAVQSLTRTLTFTSNGIASPHTISLGGRGIGGASPR